MQENELGRLLRETRIKNGYSIGGLSRDSGLSATTISMAEMGRTVPYGRTLKAFADTLGLDLSTLVDLSVRYNKRRKK